MKDEIKETPFEDLLSIKVLQKMLRLENRIEELEQINEEHRKINGELRKTINEAIQYIKEKSEEVELNFYGFPDKITSFRGSVAVLLNILQGSDE